ncbi:MBL fold metallo-hydrolase [Variovorax sp. GT1P44]|uniref:MBL fold metallo-hydrolase n=1 Tax=Variovorax sp. GT1P44 TaxID=3443742 RepID=UPI003F464DB7
MTVRRGGLRLRAWFAAAAAAMLLAACAASGPAQAPAVGKPVEVAAGVYMIQGARGGVDNHTLGRVGNAGFIVGDAGVLAIDTGTSYRHGERLLATIRSVTDKPVRLVLITHAQKDFLFGATAYRDQGIPILMHRQAAALMASRCERCLKMLKETLGEDEMRGTVMFTPDRQFDATQTLDVIGRPLRLIYYGRSSGPGDVAVFDAASGVLFAGGLLDNGRIPDLQDGDLEGWLRALEALRLLAIKVIVPGHGPAASPEAIDAQVRYLVQLKARVQELLRVGIALSAVPDAAALPEFAQWDQYETLHRRNASTLFVRLQRAQLEE